MTPFVSPTMSPELQGKFDVSAFVASLTLQGRFGAAR
jgi:hypothetical protein